MVCWLTFHIDASNNKQIGTLSFGLVLIGKYVFLITILPTTIFCVFSSIEYLGGKRTHSFWVNEEMPPLIRNSLNANKPYFG